MSPGDSNYSTCHYIKTQTKKPKGKEGICSPVVDSDSDIGYRTEVCTRRRSNPED